MREVFEGMEVTTTDEKSQTIRVKVRLRDWNQDDFCELQKGNFWEDAAEQIWQRMIPLRNATEEELFALAKKSDGIDDVVFYDLCMELFHGRHFNSDECDGIINSFDSKDVGENESQV